MQSRYLLAALAAAVLSACGGGGGDAQGTAPGGLYIGHYQEDPINNPENPMPGSFYMYLPEGDASFSGAMSFTYVGCGSADVGAVSGNKSGTALTGQWSGTVDGHVVGGPYSGRFEAATARYSGTYTNSGGKVEVPECKHSIAAYGTWEMVATEARSPADFVANVSSGQVGWTDVAGTAYWLASVYDVVKAQGGTDAVVAQNVILAQSNSSAEQTVALAGLTSGRAYVLAVTAFNGNYQRIGYTSLRYTAP